ncbi:hypothetical protein [Intrasporangium sp. DVR]|uniref:hypothetical protein n=1 Tax=Intrasporangium sp. DVR TaxID=3127867 RepID=UPI00313A4FE8
MTTTTTTTDRAPREPKPVETLREYVKRLVDTAPPLSEARKTELSRLLAGGETP